MKLKFIPALIAIVLSTLLSYGLYTFNLSENRLILSIGSFIFIVTILLILIGSNTVFPRTNTNIKATSVVFFILALVSNLIFAFIPFVVFLYILINGILFLVYILLIYLIINEKQ